jgi:S-disulfanyl-L-cysteine oxidoreductase SoxD
MRAPRERSELRVPAMFVLALLALPAGGVLFTACGGPDQPEEAATRTSDASVGPTVWTRVDADALPARFGYGRTATPAEIATLSWSVLPDGTGLPPGDGTVESGASLYQAECASCHGVDGEGTPAGNRLVGREPVDGTGWNRTIGNYWPYATTVFDYVRRTMPFEAPGSLTDEEVYALTAYLLHRNEIIPADAVMNRETLPRVEMPARDRFVPDDRDWASEERRRDGGGGERR